MGADILSRHARIGGAVQRLAVETAALLGDFRDGPVRTARFSRLAFDGDDRARFIVSRIGQFAHFRIVGAPVSSVDDQIVAVVQFVGKPARHNTSDDPRVRLGRIEDRMIGAGAVHARRAHLAMHRPDNVALRAHVAQRGFELG